MERRFVMWRFFFWFLTSVSAPWKGLLPDLEAGAEDDGPPTTPGGSHLDPNG